MTEKKEAGDHGVGYGKPPKHTQFRPGQSGNPKGRRKGTRNLKTDLTDELGERIPVREGDRTRMVSKQRAVVKTLVAQTLKGNTRAANLLLGTMMRLFDQAEGTGDLVEPLNDDEREIMKTFEERIRREAGGPARPNDRDGEAKP
jgi:hypothetical protein